MRTLELEAAIGRDGWLRVAVPSDISPGRHRVVLVIDEQVTPERPRTMQELPSFDLGPWPEGLSLHREDMYGDEGR